MAETPDFEQIAKDLCDDATAGRSMLSDEYEQLMKRHIAVLHQVWNARGAADHQEIERTFRAGFKAGFEISREGFNGGCFYEHCAPSPFSHSDDPFRAAEDAATTVMKEVIKERDH